MKKLATKLNAGCTSGSCSYADEEQGPVKPSFHFHKWLGLGPPLQVPIPDLIVVDDSHPLKHVFTNEKGFIEVVTPDVHESHKQERDAFMSILVDRFIRQSSPLANTHIQSTQPEPVYNRTVAVTKHGKFNPATGDQVHSNQRTEILTPLTLQSLLLQAMDNALEPCVIQKYIKCRASHANFYRVVYISTSADGGTVTGYNIANGSAEYHVQDLVLTYDQINSTHTGSATNLPTISDSNSKQGRVQFGDSTTTPATTTDTKNNDNNNTVANGPANAEATRAAAELKAKQEQAELLYKRKATRIIASYIKSALKQEQYPGGDWTADGGALTSRRKHRHWSMESQPGVSGNKQSGIRFLDVADYQPTERSTSPTPRSRGALKRSDTTTLEFAARRNNRYGYEIAADFQPTRSNAQLDKYGYTDSSSSRPSSSGGGRVRSPLSRSNTAASATFLTSFNINDECNTSPRTVSPSRYSNSGGSPSRKAIAKLLRSDTTLTFNRDKSSGSRQHQSQLHQYLDVFQEKSNEELSRLFLSGMALNPNMSGGDREEAKAVGRYVHEQIGLHNNLCTMSDPSTGTLSDASLKRLTITRISEHALSVVKQYVVRIYKWLQAILSAHYKLSVQFEELVCDFIRDDKNNYYFVNLKGFQLTQESIRRVKVWYDRSVLGLSVVDTDERVATSQEWKAKQIALMATPCKLCGVQYAPGATTTTYEPSHIAATKAVLAIPTRGTSPSPDDRASPGSWAKQQQQQQQQQEFQPKDATTPTRPSSAAASAMSKTAPLDSEIDIDAYIESQTALLIARRNSSLSKPFHQSPSKSRLEPNITVGEKPPVEIDSIAGVTFPPLQNPLQISRPTTPARERQSVMVPPGSEVPSLGYTLPFPAAVQLLDLYRRRNHPITTFGRGLLSTQQASEVQPSDAEGLPRAKPALASVDCCYTCFHIYRQHKQMLRKLRKLIQAVQQYKRDRNSVECCDDNGGPRTTLRSRPTSASSQRPDSHMNKSLETQLTKSLLGSTGGTRPQSAGAGRPQDKASLTAQLLAESEQQLGIATASTRPPRNRPCSAQSQRSTDDHHRHSVTSLFDNKGKNYPQQKLDCNSTEYKLAVLRKYIERKQKKELAVIIANSRLSAGISGSETLRNARHIPNTAQHYRIFVMVHYIVLDNIQKDATQTDAADVTGSLTYTLGQTQHILNFDHKATSDGNSLIWVQQCRLHHAVGTSKDIQTMFAKKSLLFRLLTFNTTTQNVSKSRPVFTSVTITPKKVSTYVHSSPLRTRCVDSSSPTRTPTTTTRTHHATDYEITKSVPMSCSGFDSDDEDGELELAVERDDDDSDGDGDDSDDNEDYFGVSAQGGQAVFIGRDSVVHEGTNETVTSGPQEDDGSSSRASSFISRHGHRRRPVINEGQFSISLEQLKLNGSGALEGTEKVDVIAPLHTVTLGRVCVKVSVAIVRDPGPLPRALYERSNRFVVEEGVFWPPPSYSDGQYTLPPSWLSMLTEKSHQIQPVAKSQSPPATKIGLTQHVMSANCSTSPADYNTLLLHSSPMKMTMQLESAIATTDHDNNRRSVAGPSTSNQVQTTTIMMPKSVTSPVRSSCAVQTSPQVTHASETHPTTSALRSPLKPAVEKESPQSRPLARRTSFMADPAITAIRNSYANAGALNVDSALPAAPDEAARVATEAPTDKTVTVPPTPAFVNGGAQSIASRRRSFVGQLYSAMEQFSTPVNGTIPTTAESVTFNRPSEIPSAPALASTVNQANPPQTAAQPASSNTAVSNAFVHRYQQAVESSRKRLSAQHSAELEVLFREFEQVVTAEVTRLDGIAVANSRRANKLLKSLSESIDQYEDKNGEIGGTGGGGFDGGSYKAGSSFSALQAVAERGLLVPSHTDDVPVTVFATSMLGTAGGGDLNNSNNNNAMNLSHDLTAPSTINLPQSPSVASTTSSPAKNRFKKIFGKYLAANRRAAAAALSPLHGTMSPVGADSTTAHVHSGGDNVALSPAATATTLLSNKRGRKGSKAMLAFEKVVDDAVTDFEFDGVLSRHMGVMDSKEAVKLITSRLAEVRQSQQQQQLTLQRQALQQPQQQQEEEASVNSPLISQYLLDLMHLTLRHLYVLGCLPERVNWALLRPFLIETLHELISE